MKYIVYITVNSVNDKIYIGVHETENPEKFDGYIGCGVNIYMPGTYKKSRTAFQYAVNKYGVKAFRRYTLKVFDTPEEAFYLESILVTEEFIRKPNVYNMTVGGRKGPDQSVKVYQYDLNGNFIKEWNSYKEIATFYNCSATSIENAVKILHNSNNYYWSTEKLEKLDLTLYNIKKTRGNIYEYDLNGNLTNTYSTTKEISEKYGITIPPVNTAIKGEWKSCNHYFSLNKVEKFVPKQKDDYKNKHIYLYNLDGTFAKEFTSCTECYKSFGETSGSKLAASIRLGRLYNKYQVSLIRVDKMKIYKYGNGKMQIDQYDLNGNFIRRFDSLAAAKREFGQGVERVIKGQANQCKNFIFKKVNDIV